MNIIQSVRCVTITAHSSTYGLSNTRYSSSTIFIHSVVRSVVWWKNVNKSYDANAHDTACSRSESNKRPIFSLSLSSREKYVFEHTYTKLSISQYFSCKTFSNIESEWNSDDHALDWRINNVLTCVYSSHTHTHTRHKHFANKNKTIEHMFDVATQYEQSDLLLHYVKLRKDFMRRERRKLKESSNTLCCLFLSHFLFAILTALNGKAANTHVKLGEMNSVCELLLPLWCAFTFVRSAQSVLVCPSTRTVDKSTLQCSHVKIKKTLLLFP